MTCERISEEQLDFHCTELANGESMLVLSHNTDLFMPIYYFSLYCLNSHVLSYYFVMYHGCNILLVC